MKLTTPITILGVTAAVITLGGLLLLYAVLSRMLEPGKPIFPEQLIPIVLAFASVIIVADFFLIRLISQLVNARLEAAKVAQIPARPVSQLPSSAQMSLPPVAPGQDAGERTTALFVRSPTEPAREESTKPLE